MAPKEKALREALKSAIETLINQEIRLLRLGQIDTPPFITEEVSYSILESKREVIELTRSMVHKEKMVLIKRMIQQVVDEEIDRAIRLRKNKCIRCIHGRFYDELGTPHMNLPIGIIRVQTIGCDKLRPSLRNRCRRFVEKESATSLEDHLRGMGLLYELREMFERFKEIWEDYLLP
jgi:hypothetical protein